MTDAAPQEHITTTEMRELFLRGSAVPATIVVKDPDIILRHLGGEINSEYFEKIIADLNVVIRYCWRALNKSPSTIDVPVRAMLDVMRYMGSMIDVVQFAALEAPGKYEAEIEIDADGLARIEAARVTISDLMISAYYSSQDEGGGFPSLAGMHLKPVDSQGTKYWLHRSTSVLRHIWNSNVSGSRSKKDFIEFCMMVLDGHGFGVTRASITESFDRHVRRQTGQD